ncbi:MAG: NlpC/P60 family protein, partial [Lachnospiraceae bacterium]|nr:NlpC/P60 family protein [Lachnospiraceae bacterium]
MKLKKFAATLALLVLIIFAGVFGTNSMNASAASNSLSATYKYLYVGQTYKPTVKGSHSSVKWSVGNSNIASVTSSGKVTAKNIGRTNVYAKVNGKKLTLKVEIVSKTAYNAVKYANKAVGSKYSQSKRMSKGYYDCGSLVWRSYSSAGMHIGGKSDWAPTAASSGSILNNAYKTVSYSGVSSSELLPGDLLFTSSSSNGRYRNITHAAMYVGNGKIVEAANSRVGVVKRNYSTSKIVLIARPTVNVSKTLQQPQMTTTKSASSSVKNTNIEVSWKKVRGASGYYVYRKAQGGSYKKIATVKGGSKVTYTDKKAYAGKYIYTIKAYSGSKTSSCNKNGMTAATKIASPSNVAAADNSKGISINWKEVQHATGYKVYRKTGSGSYSLIKNVSGKGTNKFQDNKVDDGKHYVYVVRAVRKNSDSYTTVSKNSSTTKKVCYTADSNVAVASAETTAKTTASAAETKVNKKAAEDAVKETVKETASETANETTNET